MESRIVIVNRTSPRIFRRGLLAAAAACALHGSLVAEPGREYPPTYSSRKAPWYDPFRIFTAPPTTTTATPITVEHKPLPKSTGPVHTSSNETPAWKWYGYGTPTPGTNPLAPNGSYLSVPGNWYPSVGATPGAVPAAGLMSIPGIVNDPTPIPKPTLPLTKEPPIVVVPPSDGPSLPRVNAPTSSIPPANVDWKSASIGSPAKAVEAPRASLRAPVKDESQKVEETQKVPAPRTPADRATPNLRGDSPEIPVVPAPGIVVPSSESKAPLHETYRARDGVTAAVKRACGTDVRILEITPAGAKHVVLRLAAPFAAAKAARDRLALESELAGWRFEFDLVTPLGK
jgi:hypothetical protein